MNLGSLSARALALVALACAFTALGAGVALAGQGASGYIDPTPGQTPHGGYTTSTNKCKVCHAVHGASGSGEKLLRTTVTDACKYCHVDANFSIKRVYGDGGYATNYMVDAPQGHSNVLGGCGSCHQVHAATSKTVRAAENPLASVKILKKPGATSGQDKYDTDEARYGGTNLWTAANAMNPTVTASNDLVAVSYWCTWCHKYWVDSYDRDTHVMTTATATYPSGEGMTRVAWADSSTCRSCHRGGYTNVRWTGSDWEARDWTGTTVTASGIATVGANNWPHYTVGQRLLDDAITGTGAAESDKPCMQCHVDDPSAPSAGVGVTW